MGDESSSGLELKVERRPPQTADEALVARLVAASRSIDNEPFDLAKLRADGSERAKNPIMRQPAPDVTIEPGRIGGVAGEWLSGRAPGSATLVYFHGGMFVRGSPTQARGIASTLAAALSARVFSVAYRQAPEHPFPAPIEDGLAVYRGLLDLGHDPRSIVIAGDSCGGSVTVSTVFKLREAGLPLPAACVSISPMVDLTFSGKSRASNALKDLGNDTVARAAADLYLAGADPTDPMASPVFADFHGFPPLLVVVGGNERLFDDGRALALAAHRAGAEATLAIYEDMIHVFPMFDLLTGDFALSRIAEFVRKYAVV